MEPEHQWRLGKQARANSYFKKYKMRNSFQVAEEAHRKNQPRAFRSIMVDTHKAKVPKSPLWIDRAPTLDRVLIKLVNSKKELEIQMEIGKGYKSWKV